MTQFKWTTARVDLLRALWQQGDSARVIAGKVGCTKNAVIGKARRLDLAARESPIIGACRPRKKQIPKPVEIPSGARLLISLRERECRFALNDGGPFIFCGESTESGQSFCAAHHKVVYVTARPNKADRSLKQPGAWVWP